MALIAGLVLGTCVILGASHAQADKVGVAAAVNPDAFSSLSGVPNKQLNIGKSIFYDERISTTASGLVQVLLVDGSTFTVGPNSDLVIDKFVYDPRKKTGELVATFSKGTMRFIGGKLSKNEGGVKVNTPAGALAIRGGMFQGSTSRGVYSFLFGHSMTFRGNNGQTQTVYETGYSLDLSGGRANVRPTTPEDTNAFMQALSSTGTNFGSGGTGTNGPANPAGTQQLTNLENGADQEIGDANFIMVQTAIQEQLTRLAKLQETQNNTPQNNPTNPTDPVDPVDPVDPPIKNGGTFTGYATGFLQTGSGKPLPLSPGRSRIELDPAANTVRAEIRGLKLTEAGYIWVGHGEHRFAWPSLTVTQFNLGYFGDGDGAYVDDQTFLALGDDGSSRVIRTRLLPWYNRTRFNDVTHLDPPPDQPPAGLASEPGGLCEACEFLRYGFWGADIQYANGNVTEKMGGWWVGTNEPVKKADLPLTGTATYAGTAQGTLAARDINGRWDQGRAQGAMSMSWDFRWRKGQLNITDFQSLDKPGLGTKSFGGTMWAPGYVDFGGKIRGSGGKGFAAGSFVGPRPNTAPAGVMGNFNINAYNNQWRANGVFGGSRTTFDPNGQFGKAWTDQRP